MNGKYQKNQRVITIDGQKGRIVGVEVIGEYEIILETGETVYLYPEDFKQLKGREEEQ